MSDYTSLAEPVPDNPWLCSVNHLGCKGCGERRLIYQPFGSRLRGICMECGLFYGFGSANPPRKKGRRKHAKS